MIASLQDFWNDRFSAAGYAYGTKPNEFFKSVIDTLDPGKIFVPGAGEGRDAVYAATLGWEVYCADISEDGKNKAIQLAAAKNVTIHYEVIDINRVAFPDAFFDLVVSVFFHLPSHKRINFHNDVLKWLKPGGLFIVEAFTPGQLQYSSGGPKESDMLMNIEKLTTELKCLEFIQLDEKEIVLDEGLYHRGIANVLEFVGKKKTEK